MDGAAGMIQDRVAELAAGWRACGLEPGDAVLVHSSLGRTLRRLAKAGVGPHEAVQAVLLSFLEAIGPDGTLLLPLFNFDFAKGGAFDIRTTPSQMGALTEAARKHPGAVRTGHPIYSFAVIGGEACRFAGLENLSGYGPDSPFALLKALDGKVAVLDLPDQQSMTFYHFVEEACAVPWRYHKRFEGDYAGWDGLEQRRAFSLFVRDLERGVATHVDPMGERLWAQDLYRGDRPGQGRGLRTIGARPLYDAVAAVIAAGEAEGLLYRIHGSAAA